VLSFAGESISEEEVAEILGFIDRSILYEVLEGVLEGKPASTIEALSKVAVFGYDVRTFSEQLLEAVRNVNLALQIEDAGRLLDLPDDEINRLQALAKGREGRLLQRLFDILASAVDGIHRSEQPMLLLEMAAVKMASVRPFVPVETLVDRLEALERRIRKDGGFSTREGAAPARPTEGLRVEARTPQSDSRPAAPPTPSPALASGVKKQEDTRPTGAAPSEHPPSAAASSTSAAPVPESALEGQAPELQATLPGPAEISGGSIADMLIGMARTGKSDTAQPDRPATGAASTPAVEAAAPAAEPEPQQSEPEPQQSEPEPQQSEPEPHQSEPEAAEAPAVEPDAVATVRADSIPGTASPSPIEMLTSGTGAPSSRVEAGIELSPDRPDPPGSDLCDATRWRRFVHELSQREGMGPISAPLAHAGFLQAQDKTISIGFQAAVSMRQMTELSSSPLLQQSLDEAFGGGTTLAWELDADGRSGRSLAEELRLLRAERRTELTEKAQEDPAVKQVQTVFPGTEITDVILPKSMETPDVR
ncbi:MAG: hypothetical protein VX498_15450, partial [Myxococcota bacterium]|nr:hypothetical protein [Myxococcota bacterium]